MNAVPAVLAAYSLLFAPAAQTGQRGAPADVPRDHWAFQAVDDLFRAGILDGYPDGSFKGSRLATRYEMAGTLDRLFGDVHGTTDGLQKQIDDFKSRPSLAQKTDRFADLRKQIAALQAQIDELKRTDEEVKGLTDRMGDLHAQLAKIRDEVHSTKR